MGGKILCVLILLATFFKAETFREIYQTTFPKNVIGGSGSTSTRIYGGSVVAEGKLIYMVYSMVLTDLGQVSCSSSIISLNTVLLAAHCFHSMNPDPNNVIAVAGRADLTKYMSTRLKINWTDSVNEDDFGVQERRANFIKMHERFDPGSYSYDIAFYTVSKPFIQTSTVKPIPISGDKLKPETYCLIQGWGSSDAAQRTYHLIFADKVYANTMEAGCQHKSVGPFLCLKKAQSGICQGDSGSPLVCDGAVWGVASHIISTKKSPTCGDDFEEYYTDIYPVKDFFETDNYNIIYKDSGSLGTSLHIFVPLLAISLFVQYRLW